MNHYELQPASSEKAVEVVSRTATSGVHDGENFHEPQPGTAQSAADPLLRTLAILQRQQGEQTRLLRQLLQEVEALKAVQSHQSTTVTKLDRRMRRARLLRISWLVIRTLIFAAGIGFIVYIIGMAQLQAMWERLIWFFT